jgi:hypothetical protein
MAARQRQQQHAAEEEEDSDDYCFYGARLQDEADPTTAPPRGSAPDPAAQRSLPVHQQVATDEQGRKRFHGAFTGGFSAGYFNTVGSKVRLVVWGCGGARCSAQQCSRDVLPPLTTRPCSHTLHRRAGSRPHLPAEGRHRGSAQPRALRTFWMRTSWLSARRAASR